MARIRPHEASLVIERVAAWHRKLFGREPPAYEPGRDYCSWSPDRPLGICISEDCYWHDQMESVIDECERRGIKPPWSRRQTAAWLQAAIYRRFAEAGPDEVAHTPLLGRLPAWMRGPIWRMARKRAGRAVGWIYDEGLNRGGWIYRAWGKALGWLSQ